MSSPSSSIGRWTLGVGRWTFAATAALVLCVKISSAQQRPPGYAGFNAPAPAAVDEPQAATEFVAYRRSDALPIILGDPEGTRWRLKEYPLPVYFGYPIKSYRILGTVTARRDARGPYADARLDAVYSIVQTAKLHGAEAVILLRLTQTERRAIGARAQPAVLAKALAVRWRRASD